MSGSEFRPARFGVIGAGPVGCTVAAYLADGGFDVTLCDVSAELVAPARAPGIRIEGAEEVVGSVARTITSVDDFAEEIPDVIFVTSKATALPLIGSSIQGFHRDGLYVVSWQNGIDTEAALVEMLGKRWVMRAVVNFGVELKSPGVVNMAFHHPPHHLQEMDPASRQAAVGVAQALTGAGLATERADRIVDLVWQKAIMNASMNPICAVTGLTMAQVMRDPFLQTTVGGLVREGIRVARANEVLLGWEYFPHCMEYMRTAGDHRPSMMVDVEKGRRTEVDFLNGKIVRYAEQAGVDAPMNRMIHALVKGVERVRSGGL
jgi:2-dehydropantoate 2-reductase